MLPSKLLDSMFRHLNHNLTVHAIKFVGKMVHIALGFLGSLLRGLVDDLAKSIGIFGLDQAVDFRLHI